MASTPRRGSTIGLARAALHFLASTPLLVRAAFGGGGEAGDDAVSSPAAAGGGASSAAGRGVRFGEEIHLRVVERYLKPHDTFKAEESSDVLALAREREGAASPRRSPRRRGTADAGSPEVPALPLAATGVAAGAEQQPGVEAGNTAGDVGASMGGSRRRNRSGGASASSSSTSSISKRARVEPEAGAAPSVTAAVIAAAAAEPAVAGAVEPPAPTGARRKRGRAPSAAAQQSSSTPGRKTANSMRAGAVDTVGADDAAVAPFAQAPLPAGGTKATDLGATIAAAAGCGSGDAATVSVATQGLPPGWRAQPSRGGNDVYYYNELTKEATWLLPTTSPGAGAGLSKADDGAGVGLHLLEPPPRLSRGAAPAAAPSASAAAPADSASGAAPAHVRHTADAPALDVARLMFRRRGQRKESASPPVPPMRRMQVEDSAFGAVVSAMEEEEGVGGGGGAEPHALPVPHALRGGAFSLHGVLPESSFFEGARSLPLSTSALSFGASRLSVPPVPPALLAASGTGSMGRSAPFSSTALPYLKRAAKPALALSALPHQSFHASSTAAAAATAPLGRVNAGSPAAGGGVFGGALVSALHGSERGPRAARVEAATSGDAIARRMLQTLGCLEAEEADTIAPPPPTLPAPPPLLLPLQSLHRPFPVEVVTAAPEGVTAAPTMTHNFPLQGAVEEAALPAPPPPIMAIAAPDAGSSLFSSFTFPTLHPTSWAGELDVAALVASTPSIEFSVRQ